MKSILRGLFFLLIFVTPCLGIAALKVGVGKTDITPPLGTPSAGYMERKGEGMEGSHDPLSAVSLFIDNGEKKIVLCSVDHLGFTYGMVQELQQQVHCQPQLEHCEIYIASSHTHSGGGSYLDIPLLGESLAGPYNSEVKQFYIDRTAEAIIQSTQNPIPAKIGIGYGKAREISTYRGLWPTNISPLTDVTVIKITRLDDTPFAVLFNYPLHPTVLTSQNRLFSSDFVGYARDYLQSLLGSTCQPIYFNGAQGDIIPLIVNPENRFESCDYLGKSLAETVEVIWNATSTSSTLHIETQKESYAFEPQATPFGLILPIDCYETEMNIIVLDHLHAFITIPGELSCLYDKRFKEEGNRLGFSHVSIFGLTNDAHGYIILPESWQHKTYESRLSFGGENYGELTAHRATALLKANTPQ